MKSLNYKRGVLKRLLGIKVKGDLKPGEMLQAAKDSTAKATSVRRKISNAVKSLI